MKIAVISDIHGNVFALKNALNNIKNQNVDTIICLGDLVGYGPCPNEVVETIRDNNIICIKGNYDASVVDNEFSFIRETETNKFSMPWANKELTEENKDYINKLPSSMDLNFGNIKISFVHGSPRKINEYLKEDSKEMEEVLNEFEGDILVCGHTHIPYIKEYNNKIIINEGSIGKPKIGRPNSTYVILEVSNKDTIKDVKEKIKIHEISYDTEEIVNIMKEKSFPENLIKSFIEGIE